MNSELFNIFLFVRESSMTRLGLVPSNIQSTLVNLSRRNKSYRPRNFCIPFLFLADFFRIASYCNMCTPAYINGFAAKNNSFSAEKKNENVPQGNGK